MKCNYTNSLFIKQCILYWIY